MTGLIGASRTAEPLLAALGLSASLFAHSHLVAPGPAMAVEPSYCATMQVTGYVRGAHSPWTFDQTSIWTDEPIAAASWDIPIGSYVDVEGVGTFRIADRGSGLGSSGWIDVAVWSRSEALALTSQRRVCVSPGADG